MNEIVLLAWCIMAVVGALIGMQKGKTAKGALLGFFFGPIGWIMMAFDVGVIGAAVLIGVLIGCGYIVFFLVESRSRHAPPEPPLATVVPPPAPETNAVAESKAPPSSLEPQIAPPDQLVILRGTVISAVDNVLVVTCEEDQAQGNVWNVNLGAGAGAGEIASLAKLEIKSRKEKIEKEFGSLQRVENGKVRDAKINPQERIFGKIALRDYPKLTEKLHVIAVDTQEEFQGIPLYTVNFKLPVESLPPPAEGVFAIYPPGVDTPEERREFLLQQIEAKKKGTVPVQRTSSRTRGY